MKQNSYSRVRLVVQLQNRTMNRKGYGSRFLGCRKDFIDWVSQETTIYSWYYCWILHQLNDQIREKKPVLSKKKIIISSIALPIRKIFWLMEKYELLEHPDLAVVSIKIQLIEQNSTKNFSNPFSWEASQSGVFNKTRPYCIFLLAITKFLCLLEAFVCLSLPIRDCFLTLLPGLWDLLWGNYHR